MKTLLVALLPAALSLTGCLCGGFEGQGDRVMRTASGDALQLCENGGYSVMMANGTLMEGRFSDSGTQVAGSAGETGARVFTMAADTDGSQISPELGAGWNFVALDKTELDHAHVQCADLEARDWWTTSYGSLPTDTAFARTTGDVTEEILLCASGEAHVPSYGGTMESAQYTSEAGKISVYSSFSIEGVYTGTTLTTASTGSTVVWTKVPVASLSSGARCQ